MEELVEVLYQKAISDVTSQAIFQTLVSCIDVSMSYKNHVVFPDTWKDLYDAIKKAIDAEKEETFYRCLVVFQSYVYALVADVKKVIKEKETNMNMKMHIHHLLIHAHDGKKTSRPNVLILSTLDTLMLLWMKCDKWSDHQVIGQAAISRMMEILMVQSDQLSNVISRLQHLLSSCTPLQKTRFIHGLEIPFLKLVLSTDDYKCTTHARSSTSSSDLLPNAFAVAHLHHHFWSSTFIFEHLNI